MLTGQCATAGMLETVRDMLTQDADPMVVSNCMSVIQKVRHSRGPRCVSLRRTCPVLLELRMDTRLASASKKSHQGQTQTALRPCLDPTQTSTVHQAGGARELLSKSLLYSLVNRIKVRCVSSVDRQCEHRHAQTSRRLRNTLMLYARPMPLIPFRVKSQAI